MEKFTWSIECSHTPETIDRIIMPIRKRNMLLEEMSYKNKENGKAICHITFKALPVEAEAIYKNMQRITDIIKVDRD